MSDDRNRRNYNSGTAWEAAVGYSRAVKFGRFIFVSGTTATDPSGQIVGEGDVYAQTQQIIRNIERALREYGAERKDVVRTRIYVTDIEQWSAVGRAHAEAFGMSPPASAMVEVSKLVDPRMLVEIEADAMLRSHYDDSDDS